MFHCVGQTSVFLRLCLAFFSDTTRKLHEVQTRVLLSFHVAGPTILLRRVRFPRRSLLKHQSASVRERGDVYRHPIHDAHPHFSVRLPFHGPRAPVVPVDALAVLGSFWYNRVRLRSFLSAARVNLAGNSPRFDY